MTDDATRAPDRSLVDSTLDDHKDCMQAVTEVENCLDRHPDDPDTWIGNLRDKLVLLRDELREHFDAEESGPLFGQLPTKHPRLAGPLKALQDEHRQLLEGTSDAVERSESMTDAELFELRELNARVQLLIAKLRRHEAAENELVIQAYWDEVGVGD